MPMLRRVPDAEKLVFPAGGYSLLCIKGYALKRPSDVCMSSSLFRLGEKGLPGVQVLSCFSFCFRFIFRKDRGLFLLPFFILRGGCCPCPCPCPLLFLLLCRCCPGDSPCPGVAVPSRRSVLVCLSVCCAGGPPVLLPSGAGAVGADALGAFVTFTAWRMGGVSCCPSCCPFLCWLSCSPFVRADRGGGDADMRAIGAVRPLPLSMQIQPVRRSCQV